MLSLAECVQRAGHQPCRQPLPHENNGTFSITSVGGVASTFLLEWFKRLELARQAEAACASATCGCPSLLPAAPLHLVSCHVDDDGVFKHLADPRALNRFGRHHRAVFLVGEPIEAVASVFRRRFQCWHMYRLQNCWFTRAQRNGLIPCAQPGILRFRERFGDGAARCRVPRSGPLHSLDAYAEQGEDLFGAVEQFRAWLSCRRPRCEFDILVLRYEELNRSLPALFDFLSVPPAARAIFPRVHRSHAGSQRQNVVDDAMRQKLTKIYGGLAKAVNGIPPEGLLLRNA
ncbi:hypothetical protein AB1Y20_008834 [Prymnesium parvum]|uniref:Protein-tyrosine sulfotransferase n=1 Tax=Prymnesium parvum TaxID=97485 RepID=A0AB34IUN6_PRYPA